MVKWINTHNTFVTFGEFKRWLKFVIKINTYMKIQLRLILDDGWYYFRRKDCYLTPKKNTYKDW